MQSRASIRDRHERNSSARACAARASIVAALLTAALAGCASAPARVARECPPVAAPTASPAVECTVPRGEPGREIQWFRRSAERRAAYAQAYALAWLRIEATTSPGAGGWAVVLDADETVLDNSAFQEERARAGHPTVTSAEFDAWVLREESAVFPEALAFLQRVRARGGRIAIVSNRREATCAATRANLRRLQVPFDAVLCAPPGNADKQPRFDAVANGAAVPGVGPLETLLYVGDNIRDCPGQSQQQYDTATFGTRCIVLPNPMYGSWAGEAVTPATPAPTRAPGP